MFLLCSDPSDALKVFDAAKKLHDVMWNKDFSSRLQDVEGGLQYLPATEVEALELRQLGCSKAGNPFLQ
jgi:hypothetical protein